MDRELLGWSHRELEDSLQLVREFMLPNWDIHPEMATHTRVIDTKTGRPFAARGPEWMENWQWTDGKSVDQLADYLTYSLQILKVAGLPCDGITTPGGFAGKVVPELAQATLQSVRHVSALRFLITLSSFMPTNAAWSMRGDWMVTIPNAWYRLLA